MGIGDWGLGIGDWGLGPITNTQSPIPNSQSPFIIELFKMNCYLNKLSILLDYIHIINYGSYIYVRIEKYS